jgi:hypothetical protein
MSDFILDERFMGVKKPMWELDKEQLWHRQAAWMFGQGDGLSLKDAAGLLGKSEPAVQNLFRQPWFQKEVAAILEAKGGKRDSAVLDLLRAEQINSAQTIVELRDNPKVPAIVRKACAVEILDRTMGKAVQRVETAQVAASEDPVAEVERLKQEVNRLECDQMRPIWGLQ